MESAPGRGLRWIPLVLLAATIAFLAAAALGWLPSDSRSCRGVALLFGLVTLSGTLIRPAWFWNSRKARRGRELLGERPYAVVLIGLGLAFVYLALGDTLEGCRIR
jgi:hypothetical protein